MPSVVDTGCSLVGAVCSVAGVTCSVLPQPTIAIIVIPPSMTTNNDFFQFILLLSFLCETQFSAFHHQLIAGRKSWNSVYSHKMEPLEMISLTD